MLQFSMSVSKVYRAFTLIELVVAIAIIAILAAVVAPKAIRAIERSKVAKAQVDIKSIKTGALAFYADIGLFPGSQWGTMPGDALSPADYGEGFVNGPGVHSGTAVQQAFANQAILNWNGPYLEKWAFTPWGMPYMWDWNNWDSNCNTAACQAGNPWAPDVERILWLDLAHSPGPYNQNQKVPPPSRNLLDFYVDGGDGLNNGTIVQMDNGFYGTSVEAYLVEGY